MSFLDRFRGPKQSPLAEQVALNDEALRQRGEEATANNVVLKEVETSAAERVISRTDNRPPEPIEDTPAGAHEFTDAEKERELRKIRLGNQVDIAVEKVDVIVDEIKKIDEATPIKKAA